MVRSVPRDASISLAYPDDERSCPNTRSNARDAPRKGNTLVLGRAHCAHAQAVADTTSFVSPGSPKQASYGKGCGLLGFLGSYFLLINEEHKPPDFWWNCEPSLAKTRSSVFLAQQVPGSVHSSCTSLPVYNATRPIENQLYLQGRNGFRM